MGDYFSDHANLYLYLWQGILGPLDGACISYSILSSCCLVLTDCQFIPYSVSPCYKLVIVFSQLWILYIMFRLLYLLFCLFGYVLFQLYSILHSQYLSSNDAYLPYIFSWCRFKFSASRSHIDWFSIFSSVDLVVSTHFMRTKIMTLISVFTYLVSVFLYLVGAYPSISSPV